MITGTSNSEVMRNALIKAGLVNEREDSKRDGGK